MSRLRLLLVVAAGAAFFVGGLTLAWSQTSEPTVATQTFTNVVTYTVPTETIVSTETVVSTVTVTEQTTTAPPPTTTIEPPPYTQPNVVQTTPWVCTGPQDRALVRITMSSGTADAIQFRTDCTGRLGRVEVEGVFADCFKVNPPAPAAHDLIIGGGYCHSTGPPGAGVHQDCIQAGGGRDFSINDFVFDCLGGGGGNYYINSFNGGTPLRFICTHCAFGPRHPNQIRPESSPSSGVRDSLVCLSLSGRATYLPASGNMGGNIEPAASDPRCTFEGLRAYADG